VTCLNESTAYGVSVDGVLDQNTIHSHARGAMVNWLHMNVMRIPNSASDEGIRQLFLRVQTSVFKDIQLVVVDLKIRNLVTADTVDLLAAAPTLN
jgi:hypothetical protein